MSCISVLPQGIAIPVDSDTSKDWVEAEKNSTFACVVDNIKPPNDLRWKIDEVPLDPQPDTSHHWQTDSSYRLISSFTRAEYHQRFCDGFSRTNVAR